MVHRYPIRWLTCGTDALSREWTAPNEYVSVCLVASTARKVLKRATTISVHVSPTDAALGVGGHPRTVFQKRLTTYVASDGLGVKPC